MSGHVRTGFATLAPRLSDHSRKHRGRFSLGGNDRSRRITASEASQESHGRLLGRDNCFYDCYTVRAMGSEESIYGRAGASDAEVGNWTPRKCTIMSQRRVDWRKGLREYSRTGDVIDAVLSVRGYVSQSQPTLIFKANSTSVSYLPPPSSSSNHPPPKVRSSHHRGRP